MSKCRVCRQAAVIDLPRHNAHFCPEHLQQLCRRQVEKAVEQFDMLRPGQRVVLAVSGGKDSLALWDLLVELGFEVDGVYVGLGIGDYSLAAGNRHLDYKALLNDLEARSPGAKAAFYLNFLENMAPLLAARRAAVVESLEGCARCGSPATGELCAFCRLVEVAAAHDPVPVEILRRTKARR
jgi:tRNA(Ile)-lysidine synthase TilS/MesJ